MRRQKAAAKAAEKAAPGGALSREEDPSVRSAGGAGRSRGGAAAAVPLTPEEILAKRCVRGDREARLLPPTRPSPRAGSAKARPSHPSRLRRGARPSSARRRRSGSRTRQREEEPGTRAPPPSPLHPTSSFFAGASSTRTRGTGSSRGG